MDGEGLTEENQRETILGAGVGRLRVELETCGNGEAQNSGVMLQ